MKNKASAKGSYLEKSPTYIQGLDEILLGGLPSGRTTILEGEAGSGKTVLALEFLYRGALAGEPGIWVGFEEPANQLRSNASSLGWDLPALERESRFFIFEPNIDTNAVISGDFSLKGLLAAIAGKNREIGAKRIVIDALEVGLRLFDEPRQIRAEMHVLNDWFRENRLTAILTVRPPKRIEARIFEDFFESMGDCVIFLDTRMRENISTRRLRVVKYRGSDFGHNEYPYIISNNGLFVAPISSVGLRHKPLGETMSTGIERLDTILGGGYRRSSCILIAGEAGIGKTTLVSTFVKEACKRGENVLYIGFEESQDALVGNVMSSGIDLLPCLQTGRLEFLTRFPESMGAEEHYLQAKMRIDAFKPRHVVVDAISACERMGGKLASFDYLMRLLNYCKDLGLTIFLTNQINTTKNQLEISGNEISSMVDTAILLYYQDEPGERNRILQVLKSRGIGHSNQAREFLITNNGFIIRDVYTGAGKVLTGTARQLQEEADMTAARRLEYEIRTKQLELEQLRLIKKQQNNGIIQRSKMREEKKSSNRSKKEV